MRTVEQVNKAHVFLVNTWKSFAILKKFLQGSNLSQFYNIWQGEISCDVDWKLVTSAFVDVHEF